MKKWGLAAALTLALGAVLRLRGLSFGLPSVYNPDEIAIMSRTLGFGTGDLNPHNFLYPTLYFYVLFLWEGLYFIGGWLTGAIPSLAAFQQSFFLDATGIYLAGRALSVVCGLLTLVATWRLGFRMGGPIAGAAAAMFLAVAPFAVQDAHYVKHDVPATLLIVLAITAAIRLADAAPLARGRELWIASLVAGFAVSTHYYAVFVGGPLLLAVWLAFQDSPTREGARRMAQAAGIATIAFFLGSPFLLAEPITAWRDIRANRQIVIDRAAETSGHAFSSAPQYARMLWHDAMGWPVLALALAGAFWLARHRPRHLLLLIVFAASFLLFISTTVAATRYLNPVLPFIAVLAGIAVEGLVRQLSPVAWTAPVATTLVLAASMPGALASWRLGTFFRQTDTRTLALDYFRSSVPDGSAVLVQAYSVPLPESRQSVIDALTEHLGDARKASTKFQMRLRLRTWPTPSYRVIYLGHGGLDVDKIYVDYSEFGDDSGLEAARRRGVQYVVLKRYNDESAVVGPLVEALGRQARRVAVFSPYRAPGAVSVAPFLHNTDARIDPALERPGPLLEIWQLL